MDPAIGPPTGRHSACCQYRQAQPCRGSRAQASGCSPRVSVEMADGAACLRTAQQALLDGLITDGDYEQVRTLTLTPLTAYGPTGNPHSRHGPADGALWLLKRLK